MDQHANLPDAGTVSHFALDDLAHKLQACTDNLPIDVDGARDDPEEALANLLAALATLGLITDSTTAS